MLKIQRVLIVGNVVWSKLTFLKAIIEPPASEVVGDGDESPVLPLTLQNRAAPRVHKKGECTDVATCGLVCPRDVNAAFNILLRGIGKVTNLGPGMV